MTVEEAQDVPSYQETCQQQSKGAEKQGTRNKSQWIKIEGGEAGTDKRPYARTHAEERRTTSSGNKFKLMDGGKKHKQTDWHTGLPCPTSLPEQMGATLHNVCWKAASTWRLPLP